MRPRAALRAVENGSNIGSGLLSAAPSPSALEGDGVRLADERGEDLKVGTAMERRRRARGLDGPRCARGHWQLSRRMKEKMTETETGYPERQGLYDPKNERDACGFGFVVDVKGRASHEIVEQALSVLLNLEHRGAAGAEKNTGDGAGLLLQTPHDFLEMEAAKRGLKLPRPGHYAAGMVFLPPNESGQEACARVFEQVVRDEGQQVIGWRDVPTDNSALGPSARASQPLIRQILVGRGQRPRSDDLRAEALRHPADGGEEGLAFLHPEEDHISTSRASPTRP